MAIAINGDGTITGISVGGLPDGIVDSGTLATNSVDSAELIDGAIDASHLASGVGGLYSSVAIIADVKAYNAHGGTFTSGAWRTRDLNTEISDVDGIVSISSNQFTLQAGTYTIEWSAPGLKLFNNHSRLYNITGSAVVVYGSAEYTDTGTAMSTNSLGCGVVTISGAVVFEIQHRSNATTSNHGFGHFTEVDSSSNSTYTIVKILKHA